MKKVALFALVLLTACQSLSQPDNVDQIAVLQAPNGNKHSFTVEIADDNAERSRGLMYRKDLAEDAGMLFVFDAEEPLTFWMKNTLIPLDILYFAANGSLVSWTTMLPCEADPCDIYPSVAPAKFALEVPAGTVEKYDIRADWQLVLQ